MRLGRAAIGLYALSAALAASPAFTQSDPAAGMRTGLLVVGANGETLAAERPDERFMPASTTKLFTAAAAFHWLDALEDMAPDLATIVQLEPDANGGAPDIALVGRGAPDLRDGPGCAPVCLSNLADAVAAAGVERVGDVIGDDTWFPDERWRGGWGWDDLATQYGTAVSALVINDNVLELEVRPGAETGDPIRARWRDGDDLYEIDVADTLTADERGRLWIERRPGERTFRLHGTLLAGNGRAVLTLGVDDPALVAAQKFAALLMARGVTVEGGARARHRELTAADEAAFGALHLERMGEGGDLGPVPARREAAAPEGAREIARTPAPDFGAMLTTMGKDSQNLYAELMLRHLGRLEGQGSAADGLVRVYALAGEAGIPVAAMDLNDGSGMSVYNRFTPRAAVALLHYAAEQDWGGDFRATLPVGGVDGTLAYRFRGTPLQGRMSAKTGTLLGVNALAGYMTGAGGETLIFAAFANDRPITADSANPELDAELAGIAAAN